MRKKDLFALIFFCALGAPLFAFSQETIPQPEMLMKQEMARHLRIVERAKLERSKEISASQDDYDVLHYIIDLAIDPSTEIVSGTVTASIEVIATSLNTVAFDLQDDMTVSDAKRGTVSVPFLHASDLLTIQLDRSFVQGETLDVSIVYGGHPQNQGFASFTFGTHGNGEVSIFSLSEPYYARTWWPCKDVPSDKATAAIDITVPDTLIVASNGLLQGITDFGDGTHRYEWREKYPIATYLISVAISNYATFSNYYVYSPSDSMPVEYFVYPEDIVPAQEDLSVTPDMIAFFSSKFAQYPFLNEKYGMAAFGWGGAMEHQTCTSYGDVLLTGDHRYDWINAHELSHQWWGDMITLEDWPDIWLNEGFATYSEALWTEHLYGFEAYRNRMNSRDQTSGFNGPIYNPTDLFGITVYWKGSWVLHMLRHVLNDSTFFDALRSYASDPAFVYGNATTADFQAVCETHYGASLSWFFDEWVYGEYRPDYEYSWVQYRCESTHTVSLTIKQVQTNGSFFIMPVDIHLSLASRDTTVTVWNTDTTQYFNIQMPESILALQLDPDDWILKYLSEVPTSVEKPVSSTFALTNYPNPFNPFTHIVFSTPVSGPGEIYIYDARGARIRSLYKGFLKQGRTEMVWDGRNDNGNIVSSGVYFIRLKSGYGSAVKKALLLK